MIVVVGSRHDPVAAELVSCWPNAALCSAEDLLLPGWVWRRSRPASWHWIIDARRVRDRDVSGVFLRRSAVYAQELTGIHPADRVFLAAEAHAFLSSVLAWTHARVVNPVVDGAFGEEALRPERVFDTASRLGIPLAPLRLSSETRRRTQAPTKAIEVVAGEVFGDAPHRVLERARSLVQTLQLDWAVTLFDGRHRLLALTASRRPGAAAVGALGRMLAAGRP